MADEITSVLGMISAAAGLGTAAMGLVDASKAFGGGPSNFGFSIIDTKLQPFLRAIGSSSGIYGEAQIQRTLKSNWINGVAKADQKAKAKSLIHLGLTQNNAAALAQAAGVDQTKMVALTQKIASGEPPTEDEVNVLGQFDVVLSAVLDDAYESADQKYRNNCKILSTIVSIILSLVVGAGMYKWSWTFSFLLGISAVPLAPIAKDLASSLQAAATAVSTIKR